VEAGYEAGVQLLTQHPALSAIACYSDMLAIGVLNAAHDIGRQVPDTLSVVGYNNVPEATRSHPPLTTVHYDRQQIGRDMMNRLLDIVEEKLTQHEQIILQGQLLVRESCAPAECVKGLRQLSTKN
jgi:LacI family transcriptional regulator